MTEEKPSLLHQLRIDRARKPKSKRKGLALLLAFAFLLIVVAGAAGFWWWEDYESGTPVHAVYARAVIAGGGVAEASILDASGYIIPHRQATVASQIAGRVISLPVEEGEAVAAGQVLARLDHA